MLDEKNLYMSCSLVELPYSAINSKSEWIFGVIFKVNGNPVQVLLLVYIPFYFGNSIHTELFIEAIDALQSLLDKYDELAQAKMMGDFYVNPSPPS